jgi:Protein of unknown function (DUF3789)
MVGFMSGFLIGAVVGVFTLGFLTAARRQDRGGRDDGRREKSVRI